MIENSRVQRDDIDFTVPASQPPKPFEGNEDANPEFKKRPDSGEREQHDDGQLRYKQIRELQNLPKTTDRETRDRGPQKPEPDLRDF